MARLYTGLVAGVRTHWLDSGPAPVGVTDKVAMPMCGQRGKRPFLDLSWIGYAAGALATLQQGCTLARADATTCATVQTGTNTVSAPVAANQALIGRALDADPLALVHEPTRTNTIKDSSNLYGGTGWSNGGATQGTSITAPDGVASSAQTCVDASGSYVYRVGTTASQSAATYAVSVWINSVSGSNSGIEIAMTGVDAFVNQFTSAWVRAATTNTSSGASTHTLYLYPALGNPSHSAAAQGTAGFWGAQDEAGAWASELIVTTGSAATRAGSHLSVAAPAALTSGGRTSLYASAQIKHTPANADAAMYLWMQDANNYVSVATTGVVTVAVGGSTNTTTAAAWAANDVVEFRVAFGGGLATVVKYALNGGAYTTLTITGSALGTVTIAPGASIDLLCNGTANQPGVRLRALQVVPQAAAAGW